MAEELDDAFDLFNKRHFEGKLSKIPVRWSAQVDPENLAEYVQCLDGSHEIWMNPWMKPASSVWCERLLHEMVHHKLKDDSCRLHGHKFQREMKRLANKGALNGLW